MELQQGRQQLELWGGVECTINRVGDEYFEQLERTGHIARISDFERFARLGIKALRQPILWECSPSHRSENERWEWARTALAELSGLGIRPIVGLLHHGSGPGCTDLLDPKFPEKLACYAQEVADRFPDVVDYTPVNEPLTTARFSALYGHWYPHRRDEHSFACALLNECRGVVLSMEAIRQINPSARLIQTEDLGKLHSSPALAYQAEFENERRWSTYDLLCGRVNRNHRMWQHFRWAGVAEYELEWFLEHPCPPDVIGLNHYLSGERYLDNHLTRYPAETHGGNGKDTYADVLAARVLRDGASGPRALLLECWDRYGIPIAITECHNGCTREEQLRWFLEVWRSAEQARLEGAEVIAVTAWSLLGSFDWSSLVTQKNHDYEPGVCDIRSDPPRATALAGLIHDLAAGKKVSAPVLEVPGWWHRPRRFVYGISIDESGRCEPAPTESINSDYAEVRPALIMGADGTLGRAFAHACEVRGIPYRVLSRFDVADPVSMRRAFREMNPWAVIHASKYTRVDNPSHTRLSEEREGARQLARECDQRGVQFLTFSSDLVFDGRKNDGYVECDRVAPVNAFGESKAEAEKLVHKEMPAALIVRSGPLFGPGDEFNFVVRALRCFAAGRPFSAAHDLIISPTYSLDLANACLDLVIDGERGIWHLANQGQVSWAGLAAMAGRLATVSSKTLRSCTVKELNVRTTLPAYSALTSERGVLLPGVEDALGRFICDYKGAWEVSDPQILAA
jgi:dTDP-4-dehydrorhamnose reductase